MLEISENAENENMGNPRDSSLMLRMTEKALRMTELDFRDDRK